MKQKVMDAMQSFSRALMGPVLFLPIAGMLQAISSVMSNTALVTEGGVVWTLGKFINGGVGAVIGNLGILFCVGIAMSLAKKRKADAAFLALVSYLVWLAANSRWLDVAGLTIAGDTASALYGTGQTICLGYHVTDMGVFLGMILGVVVALVHNRFIDTEFEGAMAMYGNSKFVFVVLLPIVLVMAVVASYVWPVAAAGINALTGVMASAGAFGVFLYGFLNRVLIPTGLHHLVWSPFLYSALGDSMIIGGEQIVGAKPVFLALLSDPSVAMMRDSARFLTYGLMKTFGVIGQLCRKLFAGFLPDTVYVPGTRQSLAVFRFRQVTVQQTLIQSQTSAVVGDGQHIVHGTVYAAAADPVSTFHKGLHELLLNLRGRQHFIVKYGFRYV